MVVVLCFLINEFILFYFILVEVGGVDMRFLFALFCSGFVCVRAVLFVVVVNFFFNCLDWAVAADNGLL